MKNHESRAIDELQSLYLASVSAAGDPETHATNERIPPGYELYCRGVMLLNENRESAFYSKTEGQVVDPDALERVGESIIAGFRWALETPAFQDNETEDDDRTQEIGNMMSYALSQGISEDDVIELYRTAYIRAHLDNRN